MKNEQIKFFRPRVTHFAEICVSTVWSFIIMTVIPFEVRQKDGFASVCFLCLGLLFFALGLIGIVFAVFKWNAPVYIDDEKIEQKQFGKTKTFYYAEIKDIKMYRLPKSSQWLITVYQNEDKISFEITSKVYDKFYELCTNEEIMNKLKKILKDKNLD